MAKNRGAATRAIAVCQKANIPYQISEYDEPETDDFGRHAVAHLAESGVVATAIFKTLVVAMTGKRTGFAVAMIPALERLDLKAVAQALGTSKVALADPADAQRVTGYIAGGISPLGQKQRLPIVIDESALAAGQIYFSAGKRGMQMAVSPADFIRISAAKTAAIVHE